MKSLDNKLAEIRANRSSRAFILADAKDSHQGAYDIRDICLSVPSVVGRTGIQKHVEIELWPKEHMALQNSAKALKGTLANVRA